MKEKLHIELTVPKDWSGSQAKAVWEFLESILEAIWNVYGDEIYGALEDEQQKRIPAASAELPKYDDLPF